MSIIDLESKIRDRINQRRKQQELLARSADWNRLCSALDVVGDTELALDAYLEQEPIKDIGLCYLQVYGALQLLQTQQDAVAHICDALQIKARNPPKLPHIREIRSNSVAHPAARKEERVTISNFIVRSSLNQYGFTLATVYSDGPRYSQVGVSIPKLIAEQRTAIQSVLEEILMKMDEYESQHRKTHRDKKLQEVFPQTLSYYFSKIYEAVENPQTFPLGAMHVKLLSECIKSLKQRLKDRGEWGIHDSINYEYELLEYPLEELEAFFEKRSTKLNSKDAHIFSAFIQMQFNSLQRIAAELDEEYAKNPSEDT
jgi:hypothetical protein